MKNLLKITAILFIYIPTMQSSNNENDNEIPYKP